MNRKLQLAFILGVSVVISSAASHIAARWLKIRVTPSSYLSYGPKDLKPQIVLHGSSLAYYGLDWTRISEGLGGPIGSWATAGSSPAEWEVLQGRSLDATCAIIVVSPYDLNEYFLCDFRADIVPLGQTIRDLRESDLDWQQCKRVLSQYPRLFIRKLFPTVGRSDGIMVGIRAKIQSLIGGPFAADAGDAPKFGGASKSVVTERVSDWSEARSQRRLALMRVACQGKQSFNGLKKLALVRLLQRAETQGQAMLVVMPVSPVYHREFLTPSVMREFEAALSDVQRLCPQVKAVRLDQLPSLNSNDLFSDPAHLNMYGQQIATDALVNHLQGFGAPR